MSKLSIIIPVYYNEMNLHDLYLDLFEKVLRYVEDYELVFVDDGSQDSSYEIIQELTKKDNRIVSLKLSRNFGSHAAILAGLNHCTGDCAVMKTADLQEPSTMILDMFEKWKHGNNVVLAIRADREESALQSFFSNLYYRIMRRYVLKNMPLGGFDCFLIDRKVIEVLRLMDEKNTSLMGQILWAGFKTDSIYYTRLKREKGKSRWTMKKKIKLVIDSVLSFTYLPVRFMTVIGLIFFVGSVIWAAVIIYQRIFGGIALEGWTTLMAFNLFASGLNLLTLGILGEYMWRNFDATRPRPTYIIEESNKSKHEH
jgi:polyisoprenyl-phosphate glycosyltransferase